MTRTKRHPSEQQIKVAVDAAIFTVRDGRLHVLLIKMTKRPFEGVWALPGGLIGDAEDTAGAAARILAQQTAVTDAYMEQLATFDDPARDPLGRVVSVAHVALVPDTGVALRTSDKYADVRWQPVDRLPQLAYDHRHMVDVALSRLRGKLAYTNIAWSILPTAFTLRELQDAYEAVLGGPLDKRNFLKKVLALKLVVPTGRLRKGGAHRPARLYRFRSRKPAEIAVL